MTTHDVTFQREDYRASLERWQIVHDVCGGEETVKARAEAYLPKPNPHDTSDANRKRYANYLARAVFYNATGRTLQGLLGAAFRRAPTLDCPDSMRFVEDDIDGAGESIYQQSQMALMEVLQTGRCGLLVDYPPTEAPTSKLEQQELYLRPTTTLYPPESITNWRTTRVGGRLLLSLVVISETVEEPTEDGFGLESIEQYRVLRLHEGVYHVELWRKNNNEWQLHEAWQPTDASGSSWQEIPFTFIGSVSTDPSIDSSPLYDLAVLNLAHYRNSADYEDSAYFVGQAQPWISGLDEHWRDWLQDRGLYIGSRAPILLPEGGAFGLAQAQPNTLVKEAMDQKEAQMRALGARLIQPGGAVKTATEAQSDNEAEHSVLSLAASNVSEAYIRALHWMCRFLGIDAVPLYYISQDYSWQNLDPAMMLAIVDAWQRGAYSRKDMRDLLRRFNIVDPERTDEEIDDELANEGPPLPLDNF